MKSRLRARTSTSRPVLVLGGTAQARELADRVPVVTSLAGRTSTPNLPRGEVRIGPFGGEEQLAEWVRGARALIDATHPFADRISHTAAAVADRLQVPFVVLRRPGWTAGPGDRWEWVDSVDEAARRVPDLGKRVFLTTGRTGLAPFAGITTSWFLVRTLEEPDPPLPQYCEVLRARGPFTVEDERELLCSHEIDLLVTKDSGGDSTIAKLVAARELGVPVLLVRRPILPAAPVVSSVDEAVGWLETVRS